MEVRNIKKIIIYGAGKRGKKEYEFLTEHTDIEVVAVVDSNAELWGRMHNEMLVCNPLICKKIQYDAFFIAVQNSQLKNEIRCKIKEELLLDSTKEICDNELWFCKAASYYLCEIKNEYGHGKKLIFDCADGLGLGGIEAWTIDLGKELYIQKKPIRILTKTGEYSLAADVENIVDYVLEGNDLWSWDNYSRVISYLDQFESLTVVTSKPSVVLKAAIVLKLYSNKTVNIITMIHGGTQEIYQTYLPYKDIVDCYVGVSRDIASSMVQNGVPKEKVYSTTLPFECMENLLREYSLENTEAIRIGYAARLEVPQKRVDLLIKLIEELENKSIQYIFEIAGDGEAKESIERYIESHELGKKVHMLGIIPRKDIPHFWQQQDIAINVSDFEGHSISQVEAMGNGAVIVTTKVSGVLEDVEYGKTGFYVNVGDYKKMAEIIQMLSQNRKLLPEIGSMAHDKLYKKSLMSEHLLFWDKLLKTVTQGEM